MRDGERRVVLRLARELCCTSYLSLRIPSFGAEMVQSGPLKNGDAFVLRSQQGCKVEDEEGKRKD